MITSEEGDKQVLIEEVAGAWRPRRLNGLPSLPAWHDLDEDERKRAFELAIENRKLEQALDPEGMNATIRSVLSKIQGG